MKAWKRLLIYLTLNVIVTGVTMLGVLYLWENTQVRSLMYSTIDRPLPEETNQASAPPAQNQDQPDENQAIEIVEVGGVGNLPTEYLLLKRTQEEAEETVSLQNWILRDEDGHEFPLLVQSGIGSLELHAKGAVYVYSKGGESTPIELYLGLEEPLWRPGETVTLIDAQGEVHDSYLIP